MITVNALAVSKTKTQIFNANVLISDNSLFKIGAEAIKNVAKLTYIGQVITLINTCPAEHRTVRY